MGGKKKLTQALYFCNNFVLRIFWTTQVHTSLLLFKNMSTHLRIEVHYS